MQDLIYLDNAATTFPKPDEMHEAMGRFYRECGVNPGRTGCDLALQAEEMVHGTRRKLSLLFNASLEKAGKPKDPNRLVFTANATHAMAACVFILQTTVPHSHGSVRPPRQSLHSPSLSEVLS